MTISNLKKFCASTRSQTVASHYPGEHHTTRLLNHWSVSHSPLQGESMSSCILSSEITLATKCNSGSNKWPLAIWKNSVPQRGVEAWPLAIQVRIIPLDYQDTDHYHMRMVPKFIFSRFCGKTIRSNAEAVLFRTCINIGTSVKYCKLRPFRGSDKIWFQISGQWYQVNCWNRHLPLPPLSC